MMGMEKDTDPDENILKYSSISLSPASPILAVSGHSISKNHKQLPGFLSGQPGSFIDTGLKQKKVKCYACTAGRFRNTKPAKTHQDSTVLVV